MYALPKNTSRTITIRLSRSMVPSGSFFSVAVQLSIIAAISFIYYEYPVTYARLIAEDNWGEFATFVAFVIATFLFAARFTFSKTRRQDWWFLALAIGTFIIAMEEISWGQRSLGIPTPDLFQQHNFQREINFHNLSDSALGSYYRVVSLGFVAYGVLLPLICAVYLPIDRLVKRLNLPLPTLYLTPLFVAPAYFWMFSGTFRSDEFFELFMGFAFVAFAVEQVISKFRLVNRVSYRRWLEAIAIPACLLGSFVTGMVLTNFANSSHFLHNELYRLAVSTLPDAGLYKQAKVVFSHLEMNPQAAPKDLVFKKAQFLQSLDRPEEAIEVLKQARDLELRRNSLSPDNPHVLSRLAQIYAGLGNEFISRQYRDEALTALDAKIATRDSQKLKAESSRPAWTYRIWSMKGVRDKNSRLFLARGNVFEGLEEYPKAINEYLRASKFEPTAFTRRHIQNQITKVLSVCRGENGAQKPSWQTWHKKIPWQVVEQMLQQQMQNAIAPNWCSAALPNYYSGG